MQNKSITVFLIGYNELYLLPQVDRWWHDRFKNVRFVLYDNMSDDGSDFRAEELGWEVRRFKTEGMSDLEHMKIKNECWKDCKTDFAWVSDFDELPLFNQDSLDNLEDNLSVVKLNGWEFIDTVNKIEDAKYAIQTDGYSKMALLRPKNVEEMNYEAGAHVAKPVLKSGQIGYKNLDLAHMKWFSPTHALGRALLLGNRQSEHNKKMNWSFHFGLPIEEHLKYFDTHFKNRIKIR